MYLQSIHLVSTFPACPHCRFRGCLAGLVSSWIGWKMHTAQLPQDLGLPRGPGPLESTNRGLGEAINHCCKWGYTGYGTIGSYIFWGWTSLDTSYCRVERQATVCDHLPLTAAGIQDSQWLRGSTRTARKPGLPSQIHRNWLEIRCTSTFTRSNTYAACIFFCQMHILIIRI